ncbi:MAG: helix-turn-helix transcriptional regulator [Patescibacteria group bacterium]
MKGRPTSVFAKYKKDKRYKEYYREASDMLDIAIKLSESRKKRGLTQAQLAKKAGMPQSQIARVESGNSNVTLSTVQKILSVLDKKLEIA